MEISEKDSARAAWRASQKKRGRKKVFIKPISDGALGDQGSNLDRYAEDSDSDLEPGHFAARSSGASLEALLESNQADSSLFFRSRKLLDTEAEESLPAKALQDAEQVLAIDFAALGDSLAQLPLHQLLGIEEEMFLDVEGAAGDIHRPQINVTGGAEASAQDFIPAVLESTIAVNAVAEARMHRDGCTGSGVSIQSVPQKGALRAIDEDSAICHPHGQAMALEAVRILPAEAKVPSKDVDLDDLLGMSESVGGGIARQALGLPVAVSREGRVQQEKPQTSAKPPPIADVVEDLESWLDSL